MNYIFKIIAVAKPHQQLLLFVSFLILINAVFGLISPLLIKAIVDEIEKEFTSNTGNIQVLYYLLGATFLLNFASVVVTSWSNRLGDKVSAKITLHLISTFYDRVLRLPSVIF
jgi:ABC-type bacteriocin/lantibiotic exporter with double-glycine peptidase domain